MRASYGLSIGRVARASGVHLETIRYYERIGLIPAPARTEGGHRAYEPLALRRLAFVRRARALGFSIEEIRALLSLADPGHRACDEVRVVAEARLRDVRAKIADLTRLEAVLAETVGRCGTEGPAPSCPVLDLLETEPVETNSRGDRPKT
jgi:MerR family transcriptional regulator, mercuric resistance operon regulatory protein